jgi:hypothetical protein
MTGDPTSSDPAYDALSATNVADPVLNNYDNDVAAVTVTETGVFLLLLGAYFVLPEAINHLK